MYYKPVLTYLRKSNLKFRTLALPFFIVLILLLTTILAFLSYQKGEVLYLTMSLRTSAPGEASLYYDLGDGFREENKAVTQIREDPADLVYTFAIPNRDLFRFRFDPPALFEGTLSVGNIRIVNARGKTLREIATNHLKPLYQIQTFQHAGAEVILTIQPGADDPQIGIDLDPSFRPAWSVLKDGLFLGLIAGEILLITLIYFVISYLWPRWRAHPKRRAIFVAFLFLYAGGLWVISAKATTTYLKITMQSSSSSDIAHLFFDTGSGYSGASSVQVNTSGGTDFSDHLFLLPNKKIFQFRFDPLTSAGRCVIRQMEVVNGLGASLHSLALSQVQPAHQILEYKLMDQDLRIVTEEQADDPQLIVNLQKPLHIRTIDLLLNPVFLIFALSLFPIILFLMALIFLDWRKESMEFFIKLSSNSGYQIFIAMIFYVIGIAYWFLFFNEGTPSMVYGDWVKEHVYVNTLRNAVSSGIIPWKGSEPFFRGSPNFLTNPEVSLTPDFLFLPWLSNSAYFTLHVCIFYSIGFLCLIRIAKKLRLNLLAFTFFWSVFNFNGYITSHLAVGHLVWSGYFLLPLFFLVLSGFDRFYLTKTDSFIYPVCMGGLLGVLFINGSLHIAVWCSMFMLFTILWKREMLPGVVIAIISGVLIASGRLIPAALFPPPKKYCFISGYPDFASLLDSFTVLRRVDFPSMGGVMGGLGWWEYSIYIGFVAFFVLMFCGGGTFMRCYSSDSHKIYEHHFIAAGVIMFFLSLGNVYAFIANSSILFLSTERVSSRFIVMPFVLLLIMAASGLNELLKSRPKQITPIAVVAFPFMMAELYLNYKYRCVKFIDSSIRQKLSDIPIIQIIPNNDNMYEMAVYLSWLISFFVTVAVSIFLCRKLRYSGLRKS